MQPSSQHSYPLLPTSEPNFRESADKHAIHSLIPNADPTTVSRLQTSSESLKPFQNYITKSFGYNACVTTLHRLLLRYLLSCEARGGSVVDSDEVCQDTLRIVLMWWRSLEAIGLWESQFAIINNWGTLTFFRRRCAIVSESYNRSLFTAHIVIELPVEIRKLDVSAWGKECSVSVSVSRPH